MQFGNVLSVLRTFSMLSFVFKLDTSWSQDGSYSFSYHSHITVSKIGREVRKQKEPLLKPFEYTGFQESLDYEVYLPMRSLFTLLYVATHQ